MFLIKRYYFFVMNFLILSKMSDGQTSYIHCVVENYKTKKMTDDLLGDITLAFESSGAFPDVKERLFSLYRRISSADGRRWLLSAKGRVELEFWISYLMQLISTNTTTDDGYIKCNFQELERCTYYEEEKGEGLTLQDIYDTFRSFLKSPNMEEHARFVAALIKYSDDSKQKEMLQGSPSILRFGAKHAPTQVKRVPTARRNDRLSGTLQQQLHDAIKACQDAGCTREQVEAIVQKAFPRK